MSLSVSAFLDLPAASCPSADGGGAGPRSVGRLFLCGDWSRIPIPSGAGVSFICVLTQQLWSDGLCGPGMALRSVSPQMTVAGGARIFGQGPASQSFLVPFLNVILSWNVKDCVCSSSFLHNCSFRLSLEVPTGLRASGSQFLSVSPAPGPGPQAKEGLPQEVSVQWNPFSDSQGVCLS